MKVKRSAWHYKLYCFWREVHDDDGPITFWDNIWNLVRGKGIKTREYQPSSLCKYFWYVVANTTLTTLFMLLFGVLLLVLAAILIPGIFLVDKVKERNKAKRASRPVAPVKVNEPKEPNLLVSYVKARKQKVCPLIQIVD